MAQLSAFADEISPDLDEQIRVLKEAGVGNIELRGVWDKNVMQFTTDEVRQIKAKADDNGIGFSSIGSPLGKFALDGDFNEELDRLKLAMEFCDLLGCKYIRVFSYYVPEGGTHEDCRSQVIDWIGKLIEQVEGTDIVLGHENESHIYGDLGKYCLDLHKSITSPHFKCVFDFANFVNCGEDPLDNWPGLKPHLEYFHVKDMRAADKVMVPAGQGDGGIEEILRDAVEMGFDNFLTLEPHLSVAEKNWGRTTPDMFIGAANALKEIMDRVGLAIT